MFIDFFVSHITKQQAANFYNLVKAHLSKVQYNHIIIKAYLYSDTFFMQYLNVKTTQVKQSAVLVISKLIKKIRGDASDFHQMQEEVAKVQQGKFFLITLIVIAQSGLLFLLRYSFHPSSTLILGIFAYFSLLRMPTSRKLFKSSFFLPSPR